MNESATSRNMKKYKSSQNIARKNPASKRTDLLKSRGSVTRHDDSELDKSYKSQPKLRSDGLRVFAGTKGHQYSYLAEFTHLWTNKDNDFLCTEDIFKVCMHLQFITYLINLLNLRSSSYCRM